MIDAEVARTIACSLDEAPRGAIHCLRGQRCGPDRLDVTDWSAAASCSVDGSNGHNRGSPLFVIISDKAFGRKQRNAHFGVS
jgi:hypothetical protein